MNRWQLQILANWWLQVAIREIADDLGADEATIRIALAQVLCGYRTRRECTQEIEKWE